MSIDYYAIGKRIKAERLKLSITQQTLAEWAELTPSNISHIERGKTKLSLSALVNIANALSVTTDELLCDNLSKGKVIFQDEIQKITDEMSENEVRVAADILKTLKYSLRQRFKNID